MIVYCDTNTVKMDIDGILKPVTLCPFLRHKRSWDGHARGNVLS